MMTEPRPSKRFSCHLFPPGPLFVWALVAGLVITLTSSARAASFTATLEPEIIAQGSAATLRLRFQDCSPSDSPVIPEVPGLRFTQAGRGSEMTVVPGRVSQTLVISYQVTATQTGAFTIPPITATVDGRRLATEPLTLTVAPTDPSQPQHAFLTLAFPKERYYVGESTAAEMHLHAQSGSVIRLPTLSGEGGIFGTNVSWGQQTRVATNNGIYHRLAWRVPVTFAKAGTFRYAAQDCQLRVEVRTAPRRDSIWSFVPNVESRILNLTSDPVTLQILPLPTDQVPPDFSGAVGRFSLDAHIGSTNVAVGDPLTLTVRISGSGNLPAVRWSAPTNWPGLKAYDPTSQLESGDPLGLDGTRVFEQVLIPESSSVQAIPPLRFSFFDPTTESYQTASHPGFPIKTLTAATPAAQPLIAAPGTIDSAREPIDIVHIKNRPGTLAVAPVPPLFTRPWFLALQLLPILAWAGSAFARRRREYLALNPRQLRRMQVGRRLKHGLTLLHSHAAAYQTEAFHAELYRLLQEQLGERLDLPASAISSEIVEQRLRGAVPDPALIDAVEQLFRQCDQARYAPGAATGDLQSLLSQAEKTLRQLQSLAFPHAP